MPANWKKFILISFFLVFVLIFDLKLAKPVYADPSPTSSPVQQLQPGTFDFDLDRFIQTKTNDRLTEERTKGQTVPVSIEETKGYEFDVITAEMIDRLVPLVPGKQQARAIPALAYMISSLYDHPPASTAVYAYDLLHNAGFISKPAYAQGIGFAGLSPILSIWKASRNIAYAVLIIIMLVIGFMIIFRRKIDPKTVITVQAALPRIILTLILITFSYPIAGFMIDMMYLVMFIVIELISKSVPNNLTLWAEFMQNTPDLQQRVTQGGILGLGNLWWFVMSGGMIPAFFSQTFFSGDILSGIIGGLGTAGVGAIIFKIISGAAIFTALPGIATGGIALLGGAIAFPLIILFLIFLGLFFTFIRLLFLLLNSYIQLIINIILGPLLLLQEAIPGQSAFGNWIKGLMANLIVFPATVAVIMFSWIMTSVMWSENMWGAPLTPTGGGGGKGNPLAIFIGLGIIFLAPNLVASIKKAFGAKPAVPVTAGSAFSPLTGGAATAMGSMSQFYYVQQLVSERGPVSSLVGKIPGLNKIFKKE